MTNGASHRPLAQAAADAASSELGVFEGAAGEALAEARKAMASGRWENAASLYGEALEADLRQRVAAGGGKARGGAEEAAARTERSLALSQVTDLRGWGWTRLRVEGLVPST